MSGIVCAIRGGEESQPTIAEAVRVALEHDIPIIFLYVVNLDFMTRTSSSRVHTIKDEMRDMGEFILIDARTKAKKQGTQAEGVIRDGKVGDEIIALSNERDADFVIIGTPREEREENVFTQARMRQFVERIENESGAKVILVQGSQA